MVSKSTLSNDSILEQELGSSRLKSSKNEVSFYPPASPVAPSAAKVGISSSKVYDSPIALPPDVRVSLLSELAS